VLAVLLALAVTVALVLAAGLAVADAAGYHERHARLGVAGPAGNLAALPPAQHRGTPSPASGRSSHGTAGARGYMPVRENPEVALAGRWWAGSTTTVVQPALPSGPAAVIR
jgi:hypothetical protein